MVLRCLMCFFILPTVCFADDFGPMRTAPAALNLDRDQIVEMSVGYLVNQSKKSDGSSTSKHNLTGNLLLQRMSGAWGQELKAEAVSTSDDTAGSQGIERYLAAAKLSHHQTNTTYQFAKLQWEKDLGSSFDYQASLTAGVGYDFLRHDQQALTGEVGAGYRYSQDSEIPNDTHNEVIATLGLFYERAFTSNLSFQQDLGYEYGEESEVFRSRSALNVGISEKFTAQASYQIKQLIANQGNSNDSLLSLGIKFKQ